MDIPVGVSGLAVYCVWPRVPSSLRVTSRKEIVFIQFLFSDERMLAIEMAQEFFPELACHVARSQRCRHRAMPEVGTKISVFDVVLFELTLP